jgi:hypothetical protein
VIEKPFCVVGADGSGWGRYATIEEARARVAMLSRNGEVFNVARVLP